MVLCELGDYDAAVPGEPCWSSQARRSMTSASCPHLIRNQQPLLAQTLYVIVTLTHGSTYSIHSLSDCSITRKT